MPESSQQSRIQKLSPLLINQLAAGEVVTRPASVVKEVLENAIDAGATKIDIRITQGGMGVIEISDNGSGIHPDDMQMAVTRHATSKVADVESLYGIETLGFRGEALASIAAVSRLSLTSSHNDSGVGRCLTVAGVIDDEANIVPCVCQQGTIVTVKDLYFNVPARRGNLKNVATEYAHIEAVIRQIALAYADIDLTLYHEGKKRLTLTAQTDKSSQAQLNRLDQALAVGLPNQAYPLSVDLSGLIAARQADVNLPSTNSYVSNSMSAKIDGWIWLEEGLQDNANLPKLIYINGRLVKNIAIAQQVRQAVNSLNVSFQAIGYALFFTLPHEWCNLNVHPSKQRINIHALTNINAHLYQAIRALLQPQIAMIPPNPNTAHSQDTAHPQDASHTQDKAHLHDTNGLASEIDERTDDNINIRYADNSHHHGSAKPSHAVHSPSSVYRVDGIDDIDDIDGNKNEHLKQYQLTIITKNQKSEDKAEKLAKFICQHLDLIEKFDIEPYHKFDNSFKIQIIMDVQADENSILKVIELSNRIVDRWSLFYHREQHEVSLIFQKTDVSRFEEVAFNVINWASFERVV